MLSALAMRVQEELNQVVAEILKDAQELQRKYLTLKEIELQEIDHICEKVEVEGAAEKEELKKTFVEMHDKGVSTFFAWEKSSEYYDRTFDSKVFKVQNSMLNARYEFEKKVVISKHKKNKQSTEIEEKQLWTGPFDDEQKVNLMLEHGYIGQFMENDKNEFGSCAKMTEEINEVSQPWDYENLWWIRWTVITGISQEMPKKTNTSQIMQPEGDSFFDKSKKVYGIFVPSQMTPSYLLHRKNKEPREFFEEHGFIGF